MAEAVKKKAPVAVKKRAAKAPGVAKTKAVAQAPRKSRKIQTAHVQGGDLRALEDALHSYAEAGWVAKQVIDGHYNGDASWLLVLE